MFGFYLAASIWKPGKVFKIIIKVIYHNLTKLFFWGLNGKLLMKLI